MLINSYRFAAAGGATDPNFANVSLLLHGNGTNGSATITDNSPTPKTVTPVGNAQISTAIADPFSNSTRGVLAFDGTGDFATVASASDWAVNGNYTVEFFARNNVISGPSFGKAILTSNRPGSAATTGWGFSHYQGQYVLAVNNTNSGLLGVFSENAWYHMAAVWSSGTVNFYVNGVSVWSSSVADIQTTTQGLLVVGGSSDLDPSRGFNGYIDELRITKGVARYTTNFAGSLPTAPFPDS